MSEIADQNVKKAGLNRRAVVKGAAWSVPVIAAAIAAPAASASVVAASVTLGAIGPSSASNGTSSLAVQAPTAFTVVTGSAFAGSSVTYTITIDSVQSKQKAFVEITSASPGSGSSSIGQKLTTFTGSLTTTPGNHVIDVILNGFKYSGVVTQGTFIYTVILTVSVPGSPAFVRSSTLTITY